MYIIDFRKETIKEVDADGVCMFVNNLIETQSSDLLGKRYLFVPDGDTAWYIIHNIMEGKLKNAIKH